MDIKAIQLNAAALTAEMQWLAQVIDVRMNLYWSRPCPYRDITEVAPPDLSIDQSVYSKLVRHFGVSFDERILLALALAPHIQPHVLDVFFVKNGDYDRSFTEFGGAKSQNFNGFFPTGETAAFILAANNLEKRFLLFHFLGEDHLFRKLNILKLVSPATDEPFLSGTLQISAEYLNYFTSGISYRPHFSIHFPARRIDTNLDWDDLVLDDHTTNDVEEIKDWIMYGDTLLKEWGMNRTIKPGYRTLFYGPPGTGKTLTASLLGKSTGLDVYRIDLSMVVSKYIGETEKNLANVFDQAEQKNWILFFDEADALFGKRTQTMSSNDRYANQEVSYLLQRIEDFNGVVVLSTNLKANLDEAFARRFQSMIYFPMPNAMQRLRLWQGAFSHKAVLEDKVDLKAIADKYELAGGAIINVSRYSCLMALKRGSTVVLHKDLMTGIRREFSKEGKVV